MRSRNVSPGLDVIFTTISSESTRVPPVTAERSPPDSRMTGADSPVIADSSTDAMPSTTSPSPGMSWPGRTTHRSPTCSLLDGDLGDAAVGLAHVRDRLGAGLAQRVGLRLAPALGHRLGEVREQHREPQERGDEAAEPVGRRADPVDVAEEQERREDAADLDDEHHRVLGLQARVELHEAVDERAPHDRPARTSRGPRRFEWCGSVSGPRGSSVFRPEGTSDTDTSPTP